MRACCLLFNVLVLGASSPAIAETYSTPLTLETESGAHGPYRVASFDFGVQFSQIESIKLEFVMPGGFESTFVTTGNSSYSRQLHIGLHDTNSEIGIPALQDSATALTVSPLRVPDGIPYEARFHGIRFVVLDGTLGPPFPVWPEFALDGHGRVAFIDVNRSSFHPLPKGITVSSSTAWLDPGPIESARLTIVGTPVPEPPSVVILALGSMMLLSVVVRMRSQPDPLQ